jgi:hypothetical protein
LREYVVSVPQDRCAGLSETVAPFIPLSPAVSDQLIDPVELYAAAIDTSDYVRGVAPIVRQYVPDMGDLLDVGAGGGQLGRALRDPARRWTAIEPNANMRARLARIERGPVIVATGWEKAAVAAASHDTVLAANVGASLLHTGDFLSRCRAWARHTVVWVVHAQQGPHGLVFAGCLPAAWHGEDETPGVDIVLRHLDRADRPQVTAVAEWTFSGVVPDIERLATYLADRLDWAASDRRRLAMTDHLAAQAKPDPGGYRLDIARKSAVLIWGVSWAGICVPSG